MILCGGAHQKVIARPMNSVSEPVLFPTLISENYENNHARFVYKSETGEGEAVVDWKIVDSELVIKVRVLMDIPLWMVEWTLEGIQAEKMIIPALGGQCLSDSMRPGTKLDYKYPFWWNAKFVVGEFENDGIMFFFRDTEPVHKLLRIQRGKETFAMTLGQEAVAPVTEPSLSMELRVKGFSGTWENAVDEYRNWMKSAYQLKDLENNSGFPGWAKEKNIILELWGAHRELVVPGHTFNQMIERLDKWKEIHPPKETLVYLPGFAEHGIDSHAPDYGPSPQCGGPEQFRQLIKHAHELGYHVMVHTNVLAMTYTHRMWKEFKKYQVVDVFGRQQGWAMDLDGDWLTEPYFAYMNPGYRQWREYMETVMRTLVEKYQVDGIFLDQSLLSFNDNNGVNFLQGMVDHVNYLRNAFPEILFAGEGLHEFNVRCLPMAQIHGIDSIADVHGQEGELPWRTVHPVSAALFCNFTRITGHLLTKNPENPVFDKQEESYAQIDALPVIALYNSDQSWDYPGIKKVLERAKSLKLK